MKGWDLDGVQCNGGSFSVISGLAALITVRLLLPLPSIKVKEYQTTNNKILFG